MGSMYAQILTEKKDKPKIPEIKKCKKCGSRLHFIHGKWWCNRCMKGVKTDE